MGGVSHGLDHCSERGVDEDKLGSRPAAQHRPATRHGSWTGRALGARHCSTTSLLHGVSRHTRAGVDARVRARAAGWSFIVLAATVVALLTPKQSSGEDGCGRGRGAQSRSLSSPGEARSRLPSADQPRDSASKLAPTPSLGASLISASRSRSSR
jgi:hypothetical protein